MLHQSCPDRRRTHGRLPSFGPGSSQVARAARQLDPALVRADEATARVQLDALLEHLGTLPGDR